MRWRKTGRSSMDNREIPWERAGIPRERAGIPIAANKQ